MDGVLNWLWQGGGVALATAVTLKVLGGAPARDRYLLLWLASASVLVLPTIPMIMASTAVEPALPRTAPLVEVPAGWWTSSRVLAMLWALWILTYSCRTVLAAAAVGRSKQRCRPVTLAVESRLQHWREVRGRGRATRLVLSDDVRNAAVLGCGSPVIAISPALLSLLSDDELDRVVIHEWAHVQRRDDVANALQACMRVVAGWHPAMWWFDRQLRIEREVACDDIAVAVTGSAKRYAASLFKLACLRPVRGREVGALAALSESGLRRRIARTLAAPPAFSRAAVQATIVVAGIALGVLTTTLGGLRPVVTVSSGGAVPVTTISPQRVSAQTDALSAGLKSRPPSVVSREPESRGLAIRSAELTSRPPRAKSANRLVTEPSASSRREGGHSPGGTAPAAQAESESPSGAADAPGAAEPAPVVPSSALRRPGQSPSRPTEVELSSPAPPPDLPSPSPRNTASAELAPPTPNPNVTNQKPIPPWRAAAEGGAAVGRGSKDAAVATAGFFSRFSKRIARSF